MLLVLPRSLNPAGQHLLGLFLQFDLNQLEGFIEIFGIVLEDIHV